MTNSKRELPINRIVAFLGPVIAIFAGIVADWLFVHLHFLGTWHTQGEVGTWIGDIVVFGLTSILVWAGESKWLTGWQRWESPLVAETAVVKAEPPPLPAPRPPVNPATGLPSGRQPPP